MVVDAVVVVVGAVVVVVGAVVVTAPVVDDVEQPLSPAVVSPWRRWAATAALATVIRTHGCDREPVLWQSATLPPVLVVVVAVLVVVDVELDVELDVVAAPLL